VLYLIVGDNINKTPYLQNANQFEITSTVIPKNWELIPGDLNLFTFGPKIWWEDDMWERCHNGEKEALEIYKREARIILQEGGVL
jgi:hypothetical protein